MSDPTPDRHADAKMRAYSDTIDLTGWTPHNGGSPPKTGDEPLRVLLRGKPETGPCESGPSPASVMNWNHATGVDAVKPSPMDVILGKAAADPSGDIIGWIFEDAMTDLAIRRYPHVRADLGQ